MCFIHGQIEQPELEDYKGDPIDLSKDYLIIDNEDIVRAEIEDLMDYFSRYYNIDYLDERDYNY